jgi:glutathione S-transferase
MITLYTFGPAFGLPDPSPFVMKAETLLKMSGLPYRTDKTGFRKAPKGKLPYIDDDGEIVADSTFIRWHLEKKHKVDFDRGLTAEQKAIAWAFEKMAEDNLYWVMVPMTSISTRGHGPSSRSPRRLSVLS